MASADEGTAHEDRERLAEHLAGDRLVQDVSGQMLREPVALVVGGEVERLAEVTVAANDAIDHAHHPDGALLVAPTVAELHRPVPGRRGERELTGDVGLEVLERAAGVRQHGECRLVLLDDRARPGHRPEALDPLRGRRVRVVDRPWLVRDEPVEVDGGAGRLGQEHRIAGEHPLGDHPHPHTDARVVAVEGVPRGGHGCGGSQRRDSHLRPARGGGPAVRIELLGTPEGVHRPRVDHEVAAEHPAERPPALQPGRDLRQRDQPAAGGARQGDVALAVVAHLVAEHPQHLGAGHRLEERDADVEHPGPGEQAQEPRVLAHARVGFRHESDLIGAAGADGRRGLLHHRPELGLGHHRHRQPDRNVGDGPHHGHQAHHEDESDRGDERPHEDPDAAVAGAHSPDRSAHQADQHHRGEHEDANQHRHRHHHAQACEHAFLPQVPSAPHAA